jgi:2-polyprenyl-6-methoxyphenol hydroxylase-like FAD-dependent oxidoreductase
VNLFIEPDGVVFAVQMGQELVRLVATSDVSLERIKSQWPIEAILWDTTFEVHFHVAQHYGHDHIWLAGDAVHVHSPIGGRGMNMGIADAIALASAVEHDDLLTYQSQREHEADQWVAINRTLSRLTLSSRGVWPLARQLLLTMLPLFASLFGNQIAKKAFSRLTGISENQLN